LDYIQDLGVTALWLLPFYPSPLKDDGYDIADYYSINPIYGTLGDFRAFLREAKVRGLRVITELVLNHTSDQHHWFSKSAPCQAWQPRAGILCLEQFGGQIQGRADHLQRFSSLPTGLGIRWRMPIFGIAFIRTSRT